LEKHPDKTFIGKIAKGFDFLGYHFDRERLSLAAKTVSNAIVKVYRLYEQNKTEPDNGSAVIDKYCRRWLTWTVAGLHARVN
jgi:RNA-directed DNA polymerase